MLYPAECAKNSNIPLDIDQWKSKHLVLYPAECYHFKHIPLDIDKGSPMNNKEIQKTLVGRHNELTFLHKIENSPVSEFVAVLGRRRIGKTFLKIVKLLKLIIIFQKRNFIA